MSQIQHLIAWRRSIRQQHAARTDESNNTCRAAAGQTHTYSNMWQPQGKNSAKTEAVATLRFKPTLCSHSFHCTVLWRQTGDGAVRSQFMHAGFKHFKMCKKSSQTQQMYLIQISIYIYIYIYLFILIPAPCILYYFLMWPTNAQLFHKLPYSYMFRHYRVILRQLVINTLSSYTSISNAAVGNTVYN